MRCTCTSEGTGNDSKLTLCDLHAREFERRFNENVDVDKIATRVRSDALNTVEDRLIGSKDRKRWSPMDQWIHQNIEQLRRT